MKLKNNLLFLMVMAVLLIVLLVGVIGNYTADKQSKTNSKQTTIIEKAATVTNAAYDSLSKEFVLLKKEKDSLIKLLSVRSVATQQKLNRALMLAANQNAVVKNTDLVNIAPACDSLSSLVDSLSNVVIDYQIGQDQLITELHERVKLSDEAAEKQAILYAQLRGHFNQAIDIAKLKDENLKRLNRQVRWQKTKSSVLLGVAAAAITYSIIKK